MDETEFMFGLGGSERVIVPTGDPTTRFRAQPGARESATVTKCIGSGGQVLPPLIITKGKRHTVGEQRRMNGIPASWHFSKLDSGWTNSEIAVQWLETIFEPNTKLSTPSEWCLLIIDGHRSHTSQAFCDVLWSHRIIPYLLPPQSTHVMQPLDVSIFGPLTSAYCRVQATHGPSTSYATLAIGRYADYLLAGASVAQPAEHVDSIDKAQFGTLYAQARSKVLTQSAARKAFSDSGITLNSSPEKVLRRIASASTVAEASGTSQRQPLQEIAIPRSDSAFNAVLDATLSAHAQEPNSREARTLKRMIQQTNEATYVSIAVPEAENKMLRAQQERKSKTSATVGKMVAKGDQRVLSKDVMITQEFAERERELVAKGPPNSRTERGDHRQEEEDEVASPTAAVPDGDNESDDGDDNILMQSNTPSASHAYILG
ncbi:hypothetical protein [Sporisorium scitamineum]|uniref:DDE-1 domain-containing protein n=1 Tax=Sporisorium scitamineum TaxID=49012 RepID=A0A0F7S9X7_9BASI|nr:hypothetical protein [Sporisorium scitamineum]